MTQSHLGHLSLTLLGFRVWALFVAAMGMASADVADLVTCESAPAVWTYASEEEAPLGPQLPSAYERKCRFRGVDLSGDWIMQVERMPVSMRALLVEGRDPSIASLTELIGDLQAAGVRIDESLSAMAERGEVDPGSEPADGPGSSLVLNHTGVLDAQGCSALRSAVDAHLGPSGDASGTHADSVDGAPAHQLNLNEEKLEHIVGKDNAGRVLKMASEYWLRVGFRREDDKCDSVPESIQRPREVFVRRYGPETRPWIPFHCDRAAVTVNVALGNDDEFDGGELLVATPAGRPRLRIISRNAGDATVHSSDLLHGVRMMTSGVRYSLIIFFGNSSEEREQSEVDSSGFAGAENQTAQGAAFRLLLASDAQIEACGRVLGHERLSSRELVSWSNLVALQAGETEIEAEARIGMRVEEVVKSFNAPYLRPTAILAAVEETPAAWWSLAALLSYMG
eukprot:TRINITY_DN48240_c0_g1_i1.p1 TRINITY_DN48240_c0_g1~~TRINITY_DN48240_c0_g1_i1.p1  ORF type:complete len:453 (+),score=74.57 TRINITY_DN48240_c0_g1_i1:1-1359(+)